MSSTNDQCIEVHNNKDNKMLRAAKCFIIETKIFAEMS